MENIILDIRRVQCPLHVTGWEMKKRGEVKIKNYKFRQNGRMSMKV